MLGENIMAKTKKKTKKKGKKPQTKVSYGKVELDDDEFAPEHTKIRVTTFIDHDVLQELKKTAKKERIGYQTLLNRKLREVVFGDGLPHDDLFQDIFERLDKLESKAG